ncbi:MAG TPA: hypothetical protein VHT73_09985 [Thermodesulfobacteriota bacterium]|nr:hypothetical protein [Thermodesulfobacteriota bacterium]
MPRPSELLILAVLVKVFMEFSKLIPQELFTLGALSLTFFLGLGSRSAYTVIKEGVSIAALIVFIGALYYQGYFFAYMALLLTLSLVYLFGMWVGHILGLR